MKILMVISSLGGGGAEKVAAHLANYFYDKNNDIKICYWNKSKNQYNISERVSLCELNPKARVYELSKAIKLFKPEIIFSFADVSNVIAYYAKLLSNSEAIYIPSIHNNLKVRDDNIGFQLKSFILGRLHRFVCQKANKVVIVSQDAKDSFVSYYNIPKNKCVCIYNPIFPQVEIYQSSQVENKGQLKVIAIGRLVKQKNYPLLIRVAEKLKRKDLNFVIDIYGEGELRNDLELLIKSKNLSPHVKLKGFSNKLSSVLRDYDLFLMTSSWEGFGNVLVEALENGVPVISTDCPSGPKEVLGEGEFGHLVSMEDSDSIVDLIMTKAYTKELNIERLREHLDQFTFKSVGSRYLEVFNEECNKF